MHFFYLDEAGCTGSDLSNDQQPIFVLGGLSVRDEGWNKTQNDFFEIVDDYFDSEVPANFELHASELLSPNGEGCFAGHSIEKRKKLALQLLELLEKRSHQIHLFSIDKKSLSEKVNNFNSSVCNYDLRVPYLLAYDYLITYINEYIKTKLGRTARGLLILDKKEHYHGEIERITHQRRYEGAATNRIKRIVEFSYPIESHKNPMVQLSDLIVFCSKKFLEIEAGYRSNWPEEVKQFYASCYLLIHKRIIWKNLINRQGRGFDDLNRLLDEVRVKPSRNWKQKYGVT